MHEIDPHWLALETIGSNYEEQLDANASPSLPASLRYRHRMRRFTGQAAAQWECGPAPVTAAS